MKYLPLFAPTAALLLGCATPAIKAPPAPAFVASTNPSFVICPTKDQLCPDAGTVELKNHNGAKPPPKITHSISVRYCDKPIVVWVMLENGNLARFTADEPITDEFTSVQQFVSWLEAVPHDVYDLPCVGAQAQKPIDSWPGGNDKGQAK